ncbi:MAG: LysR family transcriptional regulator [Planctomycetota bacterium]
MDTDQLEAFVAVAQTGTFTAAARRCGIAQPSLSVKVRKLEQHLGVELFDRIGRGAALTKAGELMLPKAQRILDDVHGLQESLKEDAAHGHGRVSIGAIPTIAPFLLPSVVERTKAKYRECCIHLCEEFTDALIDLLADNRLDVAVVGLPIEHPHITVEPIGKEAFVLAVPEGGDLAEGERITLAQLRSRPMIAMSDANCLGRQAAAYCAARDLKGDVICEATQLVMALELVARDVGIAIVPRLAALAGHVEGVVYRSLPGKDAVRGIGVACRSGRSKSVVIDAFVEYAAAAVREYGRAPLD